MVTASVFSCCIPEVLQPYSVSLSADTYHHMACIHFLLRWNRQTFPPGLSGSIHLNLSSICNHAAFTSSLARALLRSKSYLVQIIVCFTGISTCNVSLLMCTVGIQECTGNINDLFASPVQNQTRLFGYNCYLNSLQVFFCCISKELYLHLPDATTTAIRSWDSEIAISVPSRPAYFFGTLSRLYTQTVCQLTDGYRYTACTKVVTFFDDMAYFLSAE